MNKFLLFLISFLFVFYTHSQNENKKIMGFKNGQTRIQNNLDVTGTKNNFTNPVKQNPTINIGLKTTAVTATRFTGSMNAHGVLISESKPLQYNYGVNAISFIHRKSSTYTVNSNGNSGSIVGMYSTNTGTSWDSTCFWANSIDLARYPQGGIFNPLGNTNINNAYMTGCGPLTSGAGWTGNWYASKQITTPGTSTPGIDQQAHLDASPTIKKHAFSRYSFTNIDGGLTRSIANIVNDVNGTTNAMFGLRGAAMVKGMFSAGALVWSVDSFVPCVMNRADGSKYLNEKMIQCWDNAGVVGYVIMLGVPCGGTPCMKSYKPIVYKTTNSGASWSLLPAEDFGSPASFGGLLNYLYPINTNNVAIIPYFSSNEGIDAVVDINGQLHLACTVVGAYSNHNDSLDYTYSFGAKQYNYPYGGSFGYPVIYDFYTKTAGSWGYHKVDSMGTEAPIGPIGTLANPWINGMAGKLDYNSRIQMSRTSNGRNIFYSWTESDTTVVSDKWNTSPDIMMKGYDVTLNMQTPRYNMSAGLPITNQKSYFHYTSPKAISTSTTTFEVPLTISHNNTLDGSLPIDHYYLKGATLTSSSFSVFPLNGAGWSGPGCIVLEVPEKSIELNSFNIIPNPSNGLVSVSFFINNTQDVKVFITDYLGRVIESKAVKSNIGENNIPFDLSSYNSGLYLITLVTDSFTETKKIVKE